MAKLFAFGAYFYQALLGFGLLMVVARLLSADDYAGYSLFIGTTQFGAIACFEWLRFACSRFYPGLDADTEKAQRKTLLVEALGGTVVCLIGGAAGIAFGVPPLLAAIGGAVAACQGGSDLHLSVVRFARRFGTFSWLNGIRASVLAIGTIGGALADRSVIGATGGLLAGYLVYGAVAAFGDRSAYPRGGRWSATILREHARYGGVSAGMSVLALLSPLGLKFILTSALGPTAAAGVLLALDLLQRPFTMVVSALQAIEYPDVVEAFDRKAADLPDRLGQFYALLVTLSLVAAAGVFVILQPVAAYVVSPDLRPTFLISAPLVTIFAMLRSLTQNMSTTPAHLELNLRDLALLAVADCASFNLLAWGASVAFHGDPLAIVVGATLGAILAGAYGLTIAASLPFRLQWSPVWLGLVGAAIAAAGFFAPSPNMLAAFFLNGAASGVICLVALVELWLKRSQPRPASPKARPAI